MEDLGDLAIGADDDTGNTEYLIMLFSFRFLLVVILVICSLLYIFPLEVSACTYVTVLQKAPLISCIHCLWLCLSVGDKEKIMVVIGSTPQAS